MQVQKIFSLFKKLSVSGATMSELNDITGGNAQYTRNYTKNIANVSEDERLELPREFKSYKICYHKLWLILQTSMYQEVRFVTSYVFIDYDIYFAILFYHKLRHLIHM